MSTNITKINMETTNKLPKMETMYHKLSNATVYAKIELQNNLI